MSKNSIDLYDAGDTDSAQEIELRYPVYYAKGFFVKDEYDYSFSERFIYPKEMLEILSGKKEPRKA